MFFNHHACHIASVFDLSGLNEALVLSYDGGGEELSTLLLYKDKSSTTEILKEKWPNSLGHFYSFFTGYLGFRMLEDEYKYDKHNSIEDRLVFVYKKDTPKNINKQIISSISKVKPYD